MAALTATSSPSHASTSTKQLPNHLDQSPCSMSDAQDVKLACASCIRGHRTSSCSHKDGSKGPLYPIRSKGRPPTQCEICRKKRKESGRHVRCDCAAKSDNKRKAEQAPPSSPPAIRRKAGSTVQLYPAPSVSPVTSATWTNTSIREKRSESMLVLPSILPHSKLPPSVLPSFSEATSDQEEPPPELSRDRTSLSLSNLMNPCQCRTKGICTCCREQNKSDKPIISSPPSKSCCTEDRCCLESEEEYNGPGAKSSSSQGCCFRSKKSPASSPSAPSIELLLKAVDMSSDFIPPKCGCGDNCQCASCLDKKAADASTPGKDDCDSCIACDLNLTKPSGIPAIDQWMEAEKTQVMHGGLLTSDTAGKAELVMVHPGCSVCLETVRKKGIGILSPK